MDARNNPTTCCNCAARIIELEALLHVAHTDPVWGVLTRTGMEYHMHQLQPGYDLLYVDIDNMHDANTAYGHEGTDRRVRQALASLQMRRGDFMLSGRWLCGDELIFLLPGGTGSGAAGRLLAAFQAAGLGATIAVVPGAVNYRAAIDSAQHTVEESKRNGSRGRVLAGG